MTFPFSFFCPMSYPTKESRRELYAIMQDIPAAVHIPGRKKPYKVQGMKPYTIERLTGLWIERDAIHVSDAADALKSLCKDPYFSHKQAALIVLNGYIKIKLLWGLLWRWWAYIKGYTEEQLTPIISEGKKKLPLKACWENLVYTQDMRNDWITMTKKEAEQYRAELLSATARHSSRISPNTAG